MQYGSTEIMALRIHAHALALFWKERWGVVLSEVLALRREHALRASSSTYGWFNTHHQEAMHSWQEAIRSLDTATK